MVTKIKHFHIYCGGNFGPYGGVDLLTDLLGLYDIDIGSKGVHQYASSTFHIFSNGFLKYKNKVFCYNEKSLTNIPY